ncbi:MAG: signal peptidase I [Verrucomicrobia bacterium]|nr:signal peptidase I [Verrucomicrobiota bacterium]
MTDKPTYDRWVGALLGFFLTGSAHYLSGRRRAGLLWFFGILTMTVMALALLLISGTVSYMISLAMLLGGGILWLLMLKQSYTPVRRIGFFGGIGVIALGLVLTQAVVFVILQVVLPLRMDSVSMQPTVIGPSVNEIPADSSDGPGFFQRLFTGKRFWDIKVRNSGFISDRLAGTAATYRVGSRAYELPFPARPLQKPGQHIASGETLWSGVATSGDSLLVDRLSYRFGNPKRGDLLVFKTDGIIHIPGSETWIKRIAGLPGERIRIEPPYLIVDDKKLTTPAIFQAIASMTDGHAGFMLAMPSARLGARLAKPTDEVLLGKDEYFVLGDNTGNSLDSRYFGPVPRKSIIGKVARTYWPFTRFNALNEK